MITYREQPLLAITNNLILTQPILLLVQFKDESIINEETGWYYEPFSSPFDSIAVLVLGA
jgi:hypothetical protein